jgi:hypothetical protein
MKLVLYEHPAGAPVRPGVLWEDGVVAYVQVDHASPEEARHGGTERNHRTRQQHIGRQYT